MVQDQREKDSGSTDRPFLSIIIPALNEEKRLPGSLAKIDAFLQTQPFTAEVVIVENGSSDRTVQVVEDFLRDHPYVRLLAGEPRGKGRAIRRGMLAARGEFRFLCDADLSMPIEEVLKFIPPALDVDLAIGSREAKGAIRHGEPFYRHWMGRIFNFLVQVMALPRFNDTQCGFKALRGSVAEDIFSVSKIDGIGFDVEVIYIAQKRGYSLREVPINWYYDPDSRMRLVQDSLHIVTEVLEIRRNWRQGVYAKAQTTR
ncbi:MAG: glycosyltransferase family 2 protein [Anaerolinea sp.]|nr:glycosyltransferase family 2 protein [Anaerolinea sp.]MCC6974877.1 glycosyltransferase family 2 protein [Anaerolineae bacterium]CAG0952685.1 dolichyl-phosphate beta-glucosyltransferase [Anaerolineae bacterium]